MLLTHLHTDHVGWNTVWQDDRWVPLFPNARYLCSAKELSRVKNSERYRALWLDSLLPVIEAGQLETVDVATRPRVGGRIDFIPTPATVRTMPRWSSPLEMTTPVSPAIFCIPRSSLPIRSGIQRSAAIPGRRKSRDGEMMAWGQAIMLNGSPGILPGLPAAGWRRISKVTIAGERPGNRLQIRGTVMNNAQTVLVLAPPVSRAARWRGAAAPRLAGSGAGQDPFSAGRCAGGAGSRAGRGYL